MVLGKMPKGRSTRTTLKMNLRESQLKQLVLEEAQRYIIERQVEEFVCILKEELAKEGIVLNEEQLDEGWKERIASVLIGAALGIGGIQLQKGINDHEQSVEDRITMNVNAAADYQASDAGIISSIQKQLDNPARSVWTWEEGATSTMHPTNAKGEMVMPPEYSVMKQVLDDYESGAGQSIAPDQVSSPTTDPEENRLNFQKQFKDNQFEKENKQAARIAYLSFDEIPDNYAMPQQGKSKSELYVDLWNQFVEKPLERVEKP